ncbi:MAG: GAF domain-containing protein, partial [Aggregatilineales bacterium]
MIEEIASQISESVGSDTIMRNVLDAAQRSTRSDRSRIMLPQRDGTYHLIEYRQQSNEFEYVESFREGMHPLLYKIMQSGSAVREPDVTDSMIYTSLMAVPLMRGKDVIGVLSIESQQEDFYSAKQIGFLENLAGHAAMSLGNAWLLAESENQIRTLTYLRELTLEASTSVENQRIINAILVTSLDILEAQECSLFSFNEGEIVQAGWMSRNRKQQPKTKLTLPRFLIERVMRVRERVFIPDIKESIYSADIELAQDSSVLAIPIFRRDKVQEVLGLVFDKVPVINEKYEHTIGLLAVQVAGHLENIVLNDALLANAKQMRAILDTTRDGILLLDRHGCVQETNPALSEFLGIDMTAHIGWRLEQVIIEHFGDLQDNKNAEVLFHITKDYWQDAEKNSQREYTLEHDELIHIREFSVPVQDKDGEVLGRLFSLRDVTEEKEIAEYRQKIQGMVLHDLQSPLSSMITSLDLSIGMMKTVEPDNVEQVMEIQKISIESARHLLSLVETMRDIPRLSKGELPLD